MARRYGRNCRTSAARRGNLVRVASVVLLLASVPGFAQQTDPRSDSSFYIDSFGLVNASGFPLVARVSKVFSKLLNVADRAEYKDPGLLLVDSSDWPWAIALPDNNVVLTRGAVELCYREVSMEQGDARLALILGHELGHLAEDDYWHRDVYLSLSDHADQGTDSVLKFIGERSGLKNTSSDEWKTIVRDRELKADDRGFIYAALAGFDTRLLMQGEQQSFFHYWTEQTSAAPGEFHLSADDRAAYLKARSGALADTAELYRLGVALVHLGELSFAETVFRQVLTGFPAHEVYNNLGFIQLQRSLDQITLDIDQVFWMPASFDTAPETPGLKTRNLGTAIKSADPREGLEQAARYFGLAVKQDPGYLTGYLNLATAHYYQDRFSSAAAVLADARAIAEDPLFDQADRLGEIEALWQVAMLQSLQGSVDYLPIATARLESLVANDSAAPSVLFNLAQLYHMSGDKAAALTMWKKLADSGASAPEPFSTVVRYRRTGSTEITDGKFAPPRPGELLDRAAQSVADSLSTKLPVTMNNARLLRVGAPPGQENATREYRLDEQLVMRVTRLPRGVVAASLDHCCGAPITRQDTALGEIRVYDGVWAALVNDGEVAEIWESGSSLR